MLILVLFQVYVQPTKAALSPITLKTTSSENVTVYFLDVGQGDSILVKTPNKNILIDGGPTSAGTTVLSDLNAYHVTRIDLMVATHPHEDHIGGLISVLQSSIPTQDIIYNGYNYTTQTYNTWKTLALTHNLTQASRNQVYVMSPTINFTVLSPTGPLQFSDINAESIVMRLQVGNTSVLFTGDAQFDSEQSMLSAGLNLQSQVLKVGHHGSSTSSSQAFLSAVTPAYAVISAGIGNPYGHPTQQTLSILASNKIITYGTYANGTIIFSLNSALSSPTPTPTLSPSPSPSHNPTASPTATASPIPTPSTTPTLTPIPTPNVSMKFQKPTPSPTQTVTSEPSASLSPAPTIEPSPSAPEFPSLIILSLIAFSTLLGAIILRRKINAKGQHSFSPP